MLSLSPSATRVSRSDAPSAMTSAATDTRPARRTARFRRAGRGTGVETVKDRMIQTARRTAAGSNPRCFRRVRAAATWIRPRPHGSRDGFAGSVLDLRGSSSGITHRSRCRGTSRGPVASPRGSERRRTKDDDPDAPHGAWEIVFSLHPSGPSARPERVRPTARRTAPLQEQRAMHSESYRMRCGNHGFARCCSPPSTGWCPGTRWHPADPG